MADLYEVLHTIYGNKGKAKYAGQTCELEACAETDRLLRLKAVRKLNLGTDQPEKPKTAKAKTGHLFDMNPEELGDLTLEELNALLVERDPELEPFDDEREAIAYLSKDAG